MNTTMAIANFRTKIVRFTPTVDTAIYAAGDVVFATTAVSLSSNTSSGARGTILSSAIIDRADTAAQTITLYFLRSNVALGTINAAPSITDNDASEIIGSCTVTTSTDLGGCKYGEASGLVIPFDLDGQSIYVAATTAGTPTFTAADDLRVRLSIQLESAV